MLSKPMRNSEETKMNVFYKNFYKNSVILKKFKIPELKTIAKENKLHVSGSKPQLIERIETFFGQNKNVVKIQKLFRGFIVNKSFKIRGDALKNRKLCVNETDFYTLEPLEDIPYDEFFSYKDEKSFIYGFNITSLIELYKQKGKIINPYNREKLDYKDINNIFTLYKLTCIIYPHVFKIQAKPAIAVQRVYAPRRQSTENLLNTPIRNQPTPTPRDIQNTVVINRENPITERHQELYQRLLALREKPISVRTQELFIEIDLLGNYTNSSWFMNLEKRDYNNFFRYLYDIWYNRGQLSVEVKNNICSLGDPFLSNSINRLNIHESSIDDYRNICLNVMERMIYTGRDVEYQKLGALHVLSALTLVSPHARNNMRWLYESLMY